MGDAVKFPIKWHEECLRNNQATLYGAKVRLSLITAEVHALETICLRHEGQIIEAKKQGRDGFDRDKFMQKRNKKA